MEAARPKQYVCSGALHICMQGQRAGYCQGKSGGAAYSLQRPRHLPQAEVQSIPPAVQAARQLMNPLRFGQLQYDVDLGRHHMPFSYEGLCASPAWHRRCPCLQ